MRVVIDTNVVVSAALKDRDPEAVLVHVMERPEFEWIATQEIVEEYLEVLARPKFALSESVLSRWREVLAPSSRSPSSNVCSFPNGLRVDGAG